MFMKKFNTVKMIESAKPKTTNYKVTVDRGLYLRVSTNGNKAWLIRYVVDGNQVQYTLPELFGEGEGFIGLADAKALNVLTRV